MDFKQKKRINSNEEKYHYENLKITRELAKDLILELKELVRSIVIFGSNTNNTLDKDSDIDLMIILDNVSVFVTDELREAYNIILRKLTSKHTDKFHILTINLSDFWDMARKGDPVLINILRFGIPIFDRDLFEPVQYLLEIGKIKPSRETAVNYIARANTLLEETKNHLEEACLDLYYSIIDAVHSSLICNNITPPSPKEMPKIFKKTFNNDAKLKLFTTDIDFFYKLAKDIEYKRIKIDGKLYDLANIKAKKIISELNKYVNEKIKSTDIFKL